MPKEPESKSMEAWIWDAACNIHGAIDAPKYKDFILPLIFVKRLCDVFDDEIDRIAEEVGSREKAFKLVEMDKTLVRFYIPLKPDNVNDQVWSIIRTLADEIGQNVTTYMREIAQENQALSGIIDRIDFNATTHGVRDIDDDRLSNLIEAISKKRLGLDDVEPDLIGRSYEYLIRKFSENSGQSAGEFYTPKEVGIIMAKIMDPEPGMTIYDPCCGSAGLLIKCQLVMEEKLKQASDKEAAPLTLYGQEYIGQTWAMANMNMIIHDMQGKIEIGDSFRNPKFRDTENGGLQKFDRIVANPMWNQTMFKEKDYDADPFDRFPQDAGYPGSKADWGWMQNILSTLNEKGKAAVVFGSGSASRGSGDKKNNQEKSIRKYFIDNDLIEAILYLPFNLFYNTDSPGIIYIINKNKANDRKNKVIFINISESYIKGKPKNYLSNDAAKIILDVYSKFAQKEGFSIILNKKQIAENDYNLSPSRYVLKIKQLKNEIKNDISKKILDDLKNLRSVIDSLTKTIENTSSLTNNCKKITIFGNINSDCQLQPLSNFIEEVNVRARDIEYKNLSCSKIHGIILQNEKFKNDIASKNSSNYKVVAPNMFAYDPMLLWDGSVGCNKYDFSGIVSPAYTVFKVDSKKINLDYLEYVLRSQIMLPIYVSISDGTNMRRRKAKFIDFQAIEIPIFDRKIQEQFALNFNFINLINSTKELSKEYLQSSFLSLLFGG